MKFQNPIIKGFHPDPSICRVGEDYYLVNNSFEYFPGIPIFHSCDLVNWEQIGNCISRAEQMNLRHVGNSGGIWAPTIRYDRGIFYVTATLEQYGNFIVFTSDPYSQWSDPVWVPVGGIDPSLYFENGRAYYCTNQSLHPGKEEITLEEIDIHSGILKSPVTSIWSGTGGGYLEAPHIYHHDGWYYLMAAEGGTYFNHMVTIARSRSLWGEYEGYCGNPILTNRHDTTREVQCSGHGDLFQDHFGNWWMVHLAIRPARRTMSHLGRETFLTPVVWKDGWPTIKDGGIETIEKEGPLWNNQEKISHWKANFNRSSWEPQWIFVRERKDALFNRGEGCLQLTPSIQSTKTDIGNTFAAVRQPDFNCVIETVYEFNPEETGDESGLAIYLESGFHYRFGKRKTDQGELLILEKTAEDFMQTACLIPIENGKIRLRIECDKEQYHFYYAVGEGEFTLACSASTRFLSCEAAGKCFTGVVMGLYALSQRETTAFMEVENFFIEPCHDEYKKSTYSFQEFL